MERTLGPTPGTINHTSQCSSEKLVFPKRNYRKLKSETGMFAQAAVSLMRILADAKTGREPMVHRPLIASSRHHHLMSTAGQIGHCMCLGDFRMWVSCCAA